MSQNNQYTPQRSATWYTQRIGMLTNSELWKLIPGPKGKPGELQQTAKTYIEEKLWELKDQRVTEIKAWTLDYGNEHEPKAKQLLANALNVELLDCEFMTHPTMYYYGGSPELMPFEKDGKFYSTEIKCAATGRSHAENLLICNAENPTETAKQIYPELYWQCQGHMFLQGTNQLIFVAYHPSKVGEETSFKYCTINRVDADIAQAVSCLETGFEYYKAYGKLFGVDVAQWLSPEAKAARAASNTTLTESEQELLNKISN